MNDTARTVLTHLVARHGVSLTHDPNRCEGLLRDTCPECNREIFVLTHAVRQHVTDDLLSPRHTLPLALTEAFLVKRLEDELGFSGEAARWAVTSWAEALGRADPAPTQARTEERAPPISMPQMTESGDSRTMGREPHPCDAFCPAWYHCKPCRYPDPGNIRLLISALENDDWAVRSAAFDALANPKTGGLPLLIDALREAKDNLAWRITLILGTLHAPDAAAVLLPLLDRAPVVRDAAIWSLGEIGDKRAVTPLMKLLNQADNHVAREAEEALKKIGN